MDKQSSEATKGGRTPSQKLLYAKVATQSDKIFSTLFDLLDSKNENIRLGAAKVLANKLLADLKAMEVGGADGKPIELLINPIKYANNVSGTSQVPA